jgi:hypothetical protein
MLHASATSHTGRLLYVAELLHRVRNEYAEAIAMASVMASHSASRETKVTLEKVIEYLTRFAKAHQLLSPPAFGGVADLGDYLARLCNIKVSTDLEWRGTSLMFSYRNRQCALLESRTHYRRTHYKRGTPWCRLGSRKDFRFGIFGRERNRMLCSKQ